MGSPQIHIIHGSRNGRGVEAAASADLGEPADPVCLVRNEKSLGGVGPFSPNSVLLGVLNAFLRCPPWCWMV